MAKRRLTIILQLFVVMLTCLSGIAAQAIQLGEISGHTPIGQPLDATVGVWLTTKDKAQPLRFKLSPDITYRSNAKMSATVARMSAELATTGNGRDYIRIRSAVPIDEPVLAFRLKVYVGENAVMRNYSIALNPAPAARTASTRRDATRARSRAPIEQADYTVAAGDTLWGIARRVSRTTGANTSELVQQIFAANPQAFVGGNENRLIRGAGLRLPIGSDAAAAAPAAQAPAPVSAAPAPMATDEPVAVETVITETPVVADVPAPAATPAPVTARPAVDWRTHEPELAAKLEMLRLKYIALKAQYDVQRSDTQASATAPAETGAESLPEVSQSPTVVESAPQTSVAEQEQSEPPVVASAEEAGAADNFAAGEASMAVESGFFGTLGSLSLVTIVVMMIAAIVAITLLFIGVRKVHSSLNKRNAEIAHNAREEDFKAEVARKAANRVQMENEVQAMLASRGESPVVEPAAPVSLVDTSEPVSGRDAEIDHNIAHGRYGEAEAQLLDVIAANPKNYSAKLRLLEVFYMTENVEPFCELADDLHDNHRADLSDDEWRRVIRMGKMTAPDRMPFSGPRGLDNPNEAS